MIDFLNWFQINYPEIKESLLKCNHNFNNNETNPYHVEGDCWSHTMMVCKIAELKGYDRVIQLSALLHDIGKPEARRVNPKNNFVIFKGHEEISANLAEPLLDDLLLREMITKEESDLILELIREHGTLYRLNQDEIIERFRGKKSLFEYLIKLVECDDLGRFSLDMSKSTLDYQYLLSKLN